MSELEGRLADAVEREDWVGAEEVWLELSEDSPKKPDLYRTTLEKLIDRKQVNRVREMAELMAESWIDRDLEEATYQLLRPLVEEGLLPGHLEETFLTAVRGAYGDHPGLRVCLEKSGLKEAVTPENFRTFRNLVRLRPGTYLYHSSGWGTGKVKRIRRSSGKIVIDFEEKRNHEMKLEAAVNYVRVLPENDPRSLRFEGEEALREALEERPTEIISAYLRTRDRSVALKEVRTLLKDLVLGDREWTNWWKRVRPELMNHPRIDLSGDTSPDLTYREVRKTPDEELIEKIRYEDSPEGMRNTLRNFLSFVKQNPDVQDRVVEALRNKFDYFLDKATDNRYRPEFVKFLLWLNRKSDLIPLEEIREHVKRVLYLSESREERVREAAAVLNELQSSRDIGVVLDVLEEGIEGEDPRWIEAELLLHIRGSLWSEVALRLIENDSMEYLADALYRLTGLPGKHPLSFVSMVRYRDGEDLEALQSYLPSSLELFRNLIEITETTSDRYLPEDWTVRQMAREVEDVLLREDHRLVKEAVALMDRELTKTIREKVKRLGNFKDTTRAEILSRLEEYETAEEEKEHFWESDFIFSTEEGIRKRQEEYRELIEEKLPENRRAIEKAREMGDVSENAELDAALEERSLLTSRSSSIKRELDRARNLSDINLIDGIVQPGTRVTIEEVPDGEEKTYRILGPWDTGESENTISYLTPIGKALLGAEKGDERKVDLPEGSVTYRVREIDTLL